MSCAVFHVVYVCVCLMRECSTCSMTMYILPYSDYVHTSIKGILLLHYVSVVTIQ